MNVNQIVRDLERKGLIAKFRFTFIESIEHRNKLKIFKYLHVNEKYLKNKLRRLSDDIIYSEHSIMIISKNITIFILLLWDGLHDILSYLENKYKNNYNVDIAQFEIQSYLTNLNKKFGELIKATPNISISNSSLDIYDKIRPKKVIYRKKIYTIPISIKCDIVEKCTIFTDPYCNIISLILSHHHPNANQNRAYCLGEFKLKELNYANICKLISCIETYNLDDCYWKPKWISRLV